MTTDNASKCVEHLDKELQSLSNQIIPSEEYLKRGTEIAKKALELLKKHGGKSSFSIDRTIFSGSSGKKTTITLSDFDCVVFVNYDTPMFDGILKQFEDILLLHGNFKNIKTTRHSIQFSADGFDFDILPAPNFVLGKLCSREDAIDLQARKTLEKIKSNPGKFRYMYSSGLAEAVVRFFKKQDGFVNEMARIIKFWFKTLHLDGYPSGAKSMIELLAVKAAQKDFLPKSYLRCFSSVLSQIENFEQLNIIFEEENKFPEHQVPEKVKSQKPLVIEPANPYNNLAKSWKESQIILLKQYAKNTRGRLRKIEKVLFYVGTNTHNLESLFEPQPKVAPIKKYFHGNFMVSAGNFMVSAGNNPGIHKYPDLKIRNETLMKDPQFRNELNQFKTYMNILLDMFISSRNIPGTSVQEFTAASIQEQFQNLIDENIRGTKSNWGPALGRRHEDYDITMTLPVIFSSTSLYTQISWKQ